MEFLELASSNFNNQFKINKCLKIFGFNEDLTLEIKSFILNEITNYIFKLDGQKSSGVKVFDWLLDYKYYYVDFLKLGIDLNKQDISWWQFEVLLESIMLQKDSTISTVIGYRTYKRPVKNIKTYEEEVHKYNLQMQRRYALPQPEETINEGLQKMWKYIEEKSEVKNNE